MSRPRVPSYYAFSAPRVSASVSSARASARSFSAFVKRASAEYVKPEAELLGPARTYAREAATAPQTPATDNRRRLAHMSALGSSLV